MRYIMLLFGLLGVGGLGVISYWWGTEWLKQHNDYEANLNLLKAEQSFARTVAAAGEHPKNLLAIQAQQTNVTLMYKRQRVLPFVLSGIVLALIGIFVSFIGRGLSGAALLLVTGAGPAIFAAPMLIFSGSLIVAGIFSLFVRLGRPKEPAPMDDVDDFDPVDD